MKFYQRFAYYLGGFSIGLFFLFTVINGKDTSCSYFPNARVLKDIRSKPFYYSENATKKLNEKWVDASDIRKTLTYGDVDFDNSNVKTVGGKLYVIKGKTSKNQPIEVIIINNSERATLKDIVKK